MRNASTTPTKQHSNLDLPTRCLPQHVCLDAIHKTRCKGQSLQPEDYTDIKPTNKTRSQFDLVGSACVGINKCHPNVKQRREEMTSHTIVSMFNP